MTEQAYKIWWMLHVRACRGETLSGEEQESYNTGTAELDSEENYPASVENLRQLRERVSVLKRSEASLLTEQRDLDRRIEELESQYAAQMGQPLSPSVK